MRIVVTGASGFVGRHVCRALLDRGWSVRALVRAGRTADLPQECERALMPDLDGARWDNVVRGCDVVVHLAARVHRLKGRGGEDTELYRRENVEATRALGIAAAREGASRVIFMSTVKVFGEQSGPGGFTLADEPAPHEPYARSKLAAERALQGLAEEGGARVAIVRPPLVYGPGVGANFLRLLRQIDRGLPVPVSDTALRSLVFAGNLADLCARLVELPIERHATFLVADAAPLSTRELVERLARALGKRARPVRVPLLAATTLRALPGIGPVLRRLTSPLAVDTAQSFHSAQWRPPVGMDAALAITADWYRKAVGR